MHSSSSSSRRSSYAAASSAAERSATLAHLFLADHSGRRQTSAARCLLEGEQPLSGGERRRDLDAVLETEDPPADDLIECIAVEAEALGSQLARLGGPQQRGPRLALEKLPREALNGPQAARARANRDGGGVELIALPGVLGAVPCGTQGTRELTRAFAAADAQFRIEKVLDPVVRGLSRAACLQ